MEKVFRAKAVYDDLLSRFKDYGCRNYSDTIRAGMPSFFLYYDARFKPQDHILTLDYLLVRDCGGLCGADRIYRYLQNAAMESDLLSQFCEASVWGLLKREEERYQTPYMGNLCELVLLNAMGRTASGRPGADLILDPVDYEAAREYFSEYSLEEIEEEGAVIVRQAAKAAGNDGMMDYFRPLCHDCAFRIRNGLENSSLLHVFVL